MKTKQILIAAFMGAMLSTATAADFTSTWNSTTGNWSDNPKWSTPGAPGTFPNNGTSTYDAILGGGTLTVNQAITVEKFTMTGGTNTGGGFALTVNDALTLAGGQLDGSGTINALRGGVFTGMVMSGRTINFGDGSGPIFNTTWNSGTVLAHGGMVINNRSDSNFIVGFDGGTFWNINRSGSVTFTNEGTFTKNGGTGTAIIGGVNNGSSSFSFNNSGTVQVNSGTLALESTGGTLSGAFQIADGATLDFRSGFSGIRTLAAGATYTGAGTLLFSGVINAAAATTVDSTLNITGTLTGSSPVTVNGPLFLTGKLDAPTVNGVPYGAPNVTALGDVVFNGVGREINNSAVLNLGDGAGPDAGSTTTWSNGNIVMRSGSTINNRSDSVINATADSSMFNNFNGAAVAFNNEGTFNQNGSGTTTISGGDVNSNPFVFSNSGLIQVNSGTLFIFTTGTNTGSFVVASNATLNLGRTMNLNAGTTFTGAGTTVFSGAITASAATTVDTTLRFTGTLDGGPVDINGPFFCNGNINGPGTVNAKGGVTFDGTSREIAYGRVLNLGDGVGPTMMANWTGGEIGFRGNTNSNVINNRSDSEFITTINGNITNATYDSTATFNNEGIFTKSGGSGETIIGNVYAVNFNNSGTVNANSGTIRFNTSYTQTAGALVLNGGSVSGGTFAVRGGKIQGSGTITGAVSVSTTNGVTFEPGIGSTPGTLAITGDLVLLNTNSKFRFDIGGTTPGTQHDQLTEGGSAVFNVGGVTLEVNLLNGFVPAVSDTFTVVDGSGARINGSFANVANGSRIASADGKGTFKVSYGDNTAIEPKAFNADKVILSDFQTTPTSLTLDDNQIVENAPLGTVVGLLSAIDPNPAATFTFSLTDTANFPGNNQFQISGNQLQAKAGLDFETQTSYSIRLRVTNNSGGFLEQQFTVQVQDVPNPSTLALSANSISENLPVNTVIGALSATDPTPGATFTFALVSGAGDTDNGKFNLSGTSLRSSQIFDFETSPGPFSIRARVTNNGGESLDQVLSITLINEGVTDFVLSNSTVPENLPVGTSVGTLAATVTPVGTNVTFSLVTGAGSTNNALFTMDGSTLKIAALLDFEAAATRSIRVRATDESGETFEKDVVINVTDVLAPTTLALSANSIAENQPINSVIGALSATDPDAEATFTFALVSGAGDTDNSRFNLNGTSLRSSEVFDFETTPGPFSIRVRVTNNGGESLDQTFSITLQDQGPTAIALSSSSIPEGRPIGAPVGTFSVPGAEGGAAFTFSLIDSAAFPNNAFFSIQSNELRTSEVFDFDDPFALKTFNIRVRVTDAAGEPRDETFAITLTNIGPTDILLTPASVSENLPAGTLIGQLSASLVPADPMALPTFSAPNLPSGTAIAFGDNRSLVTNRPLSSVQTPTITVRIRAEYLGESFEKDITIQVTANPAVLRVDHPFDTSLGAGAGTLSLGDAPVGQVTSRNVILRNAGPAHIFNLRIENPAPPANEANATSNDLNTPRNLAPGETIGVNVAFSPTTFGQRSSVVTFRSDNAPDYPLTVTARGIGPEISVQQPLGTELVDGAALNFGSQPFGVSFPARSFTVKNVGSVTSLDSVAATITGPDAAFFVLDTQGFASTGSIAASASSSFRVTFQPQTEVLRTYSATLRIASTDTNENPFDIPLAGEGVTPLMIAQTAYVKASDTGLGHVFGASTAIDGNTLVVGAPNAGEVGAAYVFVRDTITGQWSEQDILIASNAEDGDIFGCSVAISGDTIVVGASGESSAATGINGDGSNNGAVASGAAYVFQRNGTDWVQQAYLKASNTGGGDRFGDEVSISGDTIVVSARSEDSAATGIGGDGSDNNAPDAGAAYVFRRDSNTWTQQAYLKASNTEQRDNFGFSVAVSGDTIVVGAQAEDSAASGINGNQADNSAQGAGAAYVFKRIGSTWAQETYLKASNPGGTDGIRSFGDNFGSAVAISGDYIVVGARFESSAAKGVDGDQTDNSAERSGAAYVFHRNAFTWTQQAYLKASNTSRANEFGRSVAIAGDLISISAIFESSAARGINGDQANSGASSSGATYLFSRAGSTWFQQAYLKASNAEADDFFGTGVSLSDGRVVVGANGEDSAATGINGNGSNNGASRAGAAYIFEVTSPEVIVHDGPDTGSARLTDNQGQAVDYGATPLGISVTRSFTISNVRALPLTVSNITAPAGYEVLNAPTAPIPAQDSAVFSVLMNAENLGTFSGNFTITSNDSANPVFEFPVTGEVQALAPGSLDPRFGTGGIVRVDFGLNDLAYDMLMFEDGGLLLGGESTVSDQSGGRFAMLRLLPNGASDSSFGINGQVTTIVDELSNATITGVTQKDGNITVVGRRKGRAWLDTPTVPCYALYRYLPDGSLDPTFGIGGRVIDLDLSEGDFTGHILTTSSGKLLVAGSHKSADQFNPRPYVRRFNKNGTPDTSFGSAAGIFTLPGFSRARCLAMNALGEVFVGGDGGGIRLWRVDSSGGLIESNTLPIIAPNGYPTDGLGGEMETATGVVTQPDGRLVVAARRQFSSGLDYGGHGFIVARTNAMLELDPSFNNMGALIEDIDSSINREHANSLALQADGKLVVVGKVGGKFAVLRYQPNGELDISFGTGGKVILDLGADGAAHKVLLDAAGDIYVAGHASNGTNQDFVVVKLFGSIDPYAAMTVRNGTTTTSPVIANGQTTAITYGSARVGGTTVSKSFRVENSGTAPLTINDVTVPAGFRFSSAASTPNVAAGGNGKVTVLMPTSTLGTFSGPVSIFTNDPANGTFTFPITGEVKPNDPPVFGSFIAKTNQGEKTTISLSKLISKVSDANGDPVSVTGFSPTSLFGASIKFEDTESLIYNPPSNFFGTDQFSVTFSDGEAEIVGIVSVQVAQDPAFNPKNSPKLEVKPTGLAINFTGIPGKTYKIQRSTDLVTWTTIANATASSTGKVTFTDPSPPQPSAFYRITF